MHPTADAGGLYQRIDEQLVTKIQELVCAGARSGKEIRRHLKIYVQRELYSGQMAPQRTNRQFFPSEATIRNHIYKSVTKERFSKIDQEDLLQKVELWKEASPDNSFEFHPYATYAIQEESLRHTDDGGDGQSDSEDDEQIVRTSTKGLLFVHQTRDQKRLLERYGNEICMLDATYKTTRYSLPLFFVVVKTNVDYQIVGSFFVQSETADAIFEALMVLKSWNPRWKPSCFMVDYLEEEMSAIERLYPDVQIFICDFHHEKAWERWLAGASNGLAVDKHNVLAKLRSVARARTEREYMDKLGELKDSKEWKSSSNLQNYITKTWLPQYKVGNTKLQASFRRYNPNIPPYLKERPHHIIKHCLEKHALAESMPSSYVEVIDMANGVFAVRRQSDADDKRNYRVQFNQPRCVCYDWESQRMPCKHFFAVFLHVPAWSFERLPIRYRDSPYFTLDDDLFRAGPSNLEESNRIGKEEVDNVPSGTEQHIEFPEVPAVTEAVQLNNLPRKAARPRKNVAKCRELLGQIRNLTYIVEGLENCIILEEVIDKLETCRRLLLGSAPKENSVILEAPVRPSRVDLKKKKPIKKEKKVHFKKLPVPSKENLFSGRVGEKANVMKRHYNVTLQDI
ncbi:PREDICTED: uncharacterized protein LOC107356297 [Acropora digitifera]|uniref:uncharacterized protein LOC107356297 n=1 Tax=Acropora digitifera TaxID=70779 RepID=UPI00077A7233|nr:PREDICTED: uncharacterized protein LOC107356297 [Acropora digitifera]